MRSVQRLLHHPVLAEGDDIPDDKATDGDAEESEMPEERHERYMEDEKVWFYYTKCCDLPFIEEEPGKLLERFPLPCKVCGKLRNKNPDLSDPK